MEEKKIVGVFFGGISPEHEVSISSASGIIPNIDRNLFNVKEIYIDREGKLWTDESVLKKVQNNETDELEPVSLDNLVNLIDIAFPVLHGIGGEDGSIQGLFQSLSIPFVGCGISASAVCLDKAIFNSLMSSYGIVKPHFLEINYQFDDKTRVKEKIHEITNKFSFPVFVKPARLGSSVGISKVNSPKLLNEALHKAKEFDQKVIIEESVEDCHEIEISILGNNKNNIACSLPGRVIPGADFYDYDDKYKNNTATFEIPVKYPQEAIVKMKQIAIQAYTLAGCSGLARVDFLVDKQERIFLNEINTLPGFTPFSMYPKLWEASGLNYKDLITKLIELGLETREVK